MAYELNFPMTLRFVLGIARTDEIYNPDFNGLLTAADIEQYMQALLNDDRYPISLGQISNEDQYLYARDEEETLKCIKIPIFTDGVIEVTSHNNTFTDMACFTNYPKLDGDEIVYALEDEEDPDSEMSTSIAYQQTITWNVKKGQVLYLDVDVEGDVTYDDYDIKFNGEHLLVKKRNSATFQSSKPDEMSASNALGALPATTTIGDLQGNSLTEIIEKLMFANNDAIVTYPSVTPHFTASYTREIGTDVSGLNASVAADMLGDLAFNVGSWSGLDADGVAHSNEPMSVSTVGDVRLSGSSPSSTFSSYATHSTQSYVTTVRWYKTDDVIYNYDGSQSSHQPTDGSRTLTTYLYGGLIIAVNADKYSTDHGGQGSACSTDTSTFNQGLSVTKVDAATRHIDKYFIFNEATNRVKAQIWVPTKITYPDSTETNVTSSITAYIYNATADNWEQSTSFSATSEYATRTVGNTTITYRKYERYATNFADCALKISVTFNFS